METIEITVGHHDAALNGTTNEIIQLAIDRAAALGGGTVRLLPGTYTMHDSVHMRANVALRGSGADTVLWKPPSSESAVAGLNGYGLYTVAVEHPERFPIGAGVFITDELSNAFYDTVATVCWKEGADLGLSRPLNHDISQIARGTVTSVYPLISGEGVDNIRLENFTIQGNAGENRYLHGCRGGGIFLLRCAGAVISGVEVQHYNGDGISFQQCVDTIVAYCTCANNAGSGLHPGSGSVGFAIRNCLLQGNQQDGIYYCLRVSYSLCEDCVIELNGRDGLSIGHRDTEALIRRNMVRHNARYGLMLRDDGCGRSGDRTLIADNTFLGNCAKEGSADLYLDARVEQLRLHNNRFAADTASQAREGNYSGMYVKHGGSSIYVAGNQSEGYPLALAEVDGYIAGIQEGLPGDPLGVENGTLPRHALRHLNR